MKRLIIFAPSYAPKLGGVEAHLLHTCAIISKEYKTMVFLRDAAIKKPYEFHGIRVQPMPGNFLGDMLLMLVNSPYLLSARAIHSHDFFPPRIRRILFWKKWIHTFHGYEGYPLNEEAIKSRQKVAKLVSKTIGVGRFIEKWYGTKCDYWIYGAVDHKIIPHSNKGKIYDVVFYGRLEEDTGFREYMKGFSLLKKRDPKLKMLVVGNGSLFVFAKKLSDKESLEVTFHPASENVLELASQAKVAFVSGYLSIIEAASLNLPIIACYGTPIKKDYLELHPRSKDFYIVKDPQEIANAFQFAIKKNPKDLSDLHNWANEQTWEKIADLYKSLY